MPVHGAEVLPDLSGDQEKFSIAEAGLSFTQGE